MRWLEPEIAAVARLDAVTRALDGVGVAGTLMLGRPEISERRVRLANLVGV